MTDSSLAISVQNVNFSIKETSILKEVSFTVTAGEFIGIIGPNGGGKTTLLHLLMGFLRPNSGEILLFGKNPKEMRNKMAWVPQSFSYDASFPISIFEIILMGRLSKLSWHGNYSKEDKKAVYEALEIMDLTKYKNVLLTELSGGLIQRALIARALVSNPSLLLLDEPTASIDSQAQEKIHLILANLKRKVTILMVTHNLGSVMEHVDRVFCVQEELFSIPPKKVCEHFTWGLYHPPLKNM